MQLVCNFSFYYFSFTHLCSEPIARTAHLLEGLPSIWAGPVCSMLTRRWEALPVQVQMQEQNQWSSEGRIGTSILLIDEPPALLTPSSPLTPIRLRHPLGPTLRFPKIALVLPEIAGCVGPYLTSGITPGVRLEHFGGWSYVLTEALDETLIEIGKSGPCERLETRPFCQSKKGSLP